MLDPVEAAPLLRVLGLLRRDASMPPAQVRKTMQINHMVALLEPILLEIAEKRPLVRILDLGCGASYLTLLLGWCFAHVWRHPVRILGVDRNDAIIRRSRERAAIVDLDPVLRFSASDLVGADLPGLWSQAYPEDEDAPLRADALFALHACDTATDEALAAGVALGADFIAAAPCCQAELARGWGGLAEAGAGGDFAPVWASPHLRRELGATMTDTMRTLLLRGCGYRVTAMEFVPSEHTPKNTLLRAVRQEVGSDSDEAFRDYLALRRATGDVSIQLERRLPNSHQERLRSLSS